MIAERFKDANNGSPVYLKLKPADAVSQPGTAVHLQVRTSLAQHPSGAAQRVSQFLAVLHSFAGHVFNDFFSFFFHLR